MSNSELPRWFFGLAFAAVVFQVISAFALAGGILVCYMAIGPIVGLPGSNVLSGVDFRVSYALAAGGFVLALCGSFGVIVGGILRVAISINRATRYLAESVATTRDAAPTLSSVGSMLAADKIMSCPSCRLPVASGSRFCHHCGATVLAK